MNDTVSISITAVTKRGVEIGRRGDYHLYRRTTCVVCGRERWQRINEESMRCRKCCLAAIARPEPIAERALRAMVEFRFIYGMWPTARELAAKLARTAPYMRKVLNGLAVQGLVEWYNGGWCPTPKAVK